MKAIFLSACLKISNPPRLRALTLLPLFALAGLARADNPVNAGAYPSLIFQAAFDEGVDAGYAKGDPKLRTLSTGGQNGPSEVGLNTNGLTRIAKGKGVRGDALEFTRKQSPWLFFKARENTGYAEKNWSGTVSFWLRLDPEEDLEPGYCDPIQITPRAWNDAAFFVDFDKEGDPRDFRLGAFADLKVWNSEGKSMQDVPESQRPLHKVESPPFNREAWTHVAFTWERFNTGESNGVATLYLNGERKGEVKDWNQQFTWKADEEPRMFIGLNYIGLFDELNCFSSALSASEIKKIYSNTPANGVASASVRARKIPSRGNRGTRVRRGGAAIAALPAVAAQEQGLGVGSERAGKALSLCWAGREV